MVKCDQYLLRETTCISRLLTQRLNILDCIMLSSWDTIVPPISFCCNNIYVEISQKMCCIVPLFLRGSLIELFSMPMLEI